MLAESWDLSSDARQIKLNLRKGVQFHSGREFTSDDVKYTMLRVRDPNVPLAVFWSTFSKWFTIDTPDKYTVVLQSDTPRPTMFDFFESMNIVDQVTLEGPDSKTKLVGTGPFSFVEWVQGDHLTFAKNKNYWQSGRPYLDAFKASIISPASILVQIEAGALDLARFSPGNDMARLKADPKYQITTHPYPGSMLNFGLTTKPPLDNKMVRQALNYAIDRKRFADTVMLGTATPRSLPWDTVSPAFDADKNNAYPFDLDKARALLQESGATNLELDYAIVPGNYPELSQFGQVYQGDLASIGVKLNIQAMDLAAWIDLVANRKAYRGIYAANDLPTNLSPGTFVSGAASVRPGTNNSSFQSDSWTQLVGDVSTETDPAKLKQLYSEINDVLLDESFSVPISSYPIILTGLSSVRNITPTLHGNYSYTDTWLDS
jgi:peptide/nickel transport system substrate-binding protein